MENEQERQLRVADQLMTMHSALRDRCSRWSLGLSCLLLAASALLCALVFIDDVHLRAWHLAPPLARDLLGLLSVILFVGSVIELRVDWAGRARIHDHAVRRLFRLIALLRSAPTAERESPHAMADEYKRAMDDIVPVPERAFNRLKAHHLFKVAMSKRISRNPKAWLWLLHLQLRWEGVASLIAKRDEAKND